MYVVDPRDAYERIAVRVDRVVEPVELRQRRADDHAPDELTAGRVPLEREEIERGKGAILVADLPLALI